ncbi:MAG: hypothetical protein ABW128_07065 [Rhizorhabdus sp.]
MEDLFAQPATPAPAQASAPLSFAIGQGVTLRSGRRAWIVAIDPVDLAPGTTRLALVIGGPAPMSDIRFNVRLVDSEGSLFEQDEHTTARQVEQSPQVPPCADPAALLAQALDKREAFRASMREEQARNIAARDEAKANVARYAPAWAKAALIAECHEDASDSMSDYFHHRTTRVVVLGWSRHERDLFAEMRKAAATFEETAHLATAPESAEHREKYSMGAGYYLKSGFRDSSGWCVKKRSIGYLSSDVLEFTDDAKAHNAIARPAAPQEPAADPVATGGNASGLFRITKQHNAKKGFDYWLCELVERVEREDYERFLSQAKALGGWYARAWSGIPGGFAFKREPAALEFTGQGAGDPAPTDGTPAAPVERAAPAPVSGAADKLRDMADALQAAIDDKFRDRRANTPKQQRQAAEARQDGRDLERAQRIMRALADRHDAGTVPACLASVRSKAAIVDLAREGLEHRGGYYDAGTPTGAPAFRHDAAQVAQAVEAWALLDTAQDDERRAAEELRQKIDGLKFAKIPGYFPTPAALVERMIAEAYLPEGADVLEPSAGSGAIADALRDAGHNVTCVERHATLCSILEAKGHKVIAGDFQEAADLGQFDAVLMNPPFEKGQDCHHVDLAWSYVKPGGALVAIMGAGVMFRSTSPYRGFRAFVAEHGGTFEEIPAGTFKESGTGVASVLLTMTKPEA